jgi:membrane protein
MRGAVSLVAASQQLAVSSIKVARAGLRALAWARQFFLIDWIVRLQRGLRRHNAFLAASAMAFNFFLSFIPILALLGYILGHFVRERGVAEFLKPLGEAVPFAKEIAGNELERMAGASVTVAPVSIIGFLWVTSSGTSSLIDTFELALGAKRRAWYVQRAIAFGWVIVVLGLVSGTLWTAMRIDKYLGDDSLPIDRRVTALLGSWEPWGVLAALAIIGVSSLAVLYRYGVEHPAGRPRFAWPGAILAMITSTLVTWGFGAYVRDLARYAVFYGSLAAVATILVWLYLISLALLLGAELNAQLETHAVKQTNAS